MPARSRSHLVSKLMVASSLPLGFLVPILPAAGLPLAHAELVAVLVPPIFVTGIAAAYLVSGLGRSAAKVDVPVAASAAAAGVLAAAAFLAGEPRLLSPGLLLFAAVAVFSARPARDTVRLSYLGLAAAYAAGGVYLLLPGPGDPFLRLLGLVYAVAVGSIYAVTAHSLPRTYGDRPRRWLVATVYALNLLGALSLGLGGLAAAAVLLATGMVLYPAAVGLDRLSRYLEKARTVKAEAARRSHLYFLAGHALVPLMVLYVAVGWALLLQGRGWLLLVHGVAAGFTLLHIEIHAPMMVPVILGTGHARRYSPVNYALLAPAPLMVACCGLAALLLVLASLAATLLVAWPAPRKRPAQRRGNTGRSS
jgi:hypothetical protein